MSVLEKKVGLYSKLGRSDPTITDQRKTKSKDQAKSRRDKEKKEFDNLFYALPIESKPNEKNTNLQISLGFLLCRKLYERPRKKALLKWYKDKIRSENANNKEILPSDVEIIIKDNTKDNFNYKTYKNINLELLENSLPHSLLNETSIFSTLLKMALNGLVIHIILTGESAGRIIHVSENSYKFVGIEPRNLIGRFIFDLIHIVDIQLLLRAMRVPFVLTLDNEVEDWKVSNNSNSIDKYRDGRTNILDNDVNIESELDILAKSDSLKLKLRNSDGKTSSGNKPNNNRSGTNTDSSSLEKKTGTPPKNNTIYQSKLSSEFTFDINEILSFDNVILRCHQKLNERQVRCEINEQLFKSVYLTESWKKLRISRVENSLITGISDPTANHDYFIQMSPFYCGTYRVMKFSGKKIYSKSAGEKFCFGFLEDAMNHISVNNYRISQVPIQSHEALAIILECDLYFSTKMIKCSPNSKTLRTEKFDKVKGLPTIDRDLFLQVAIFDIEELNHIKNDVLRTGYGESRYPIRFDFDEEDSYVVRAYLRENKSATKNKNSVEQQATGNVQVYRDLNLVTNTDDFHRLNSSAKELIFDIVLVLEILYDSEDNQRISDKFLCDLARSNDVNSPNINVPIKKEIKTKTANSESNVKVKTVTIPQNDELEATPLVEEQSIIVNNPNSPLTIEIPTRNTEPSNAIINQQLFAFDDLRKSFEYRNQNEQSEWVMNNWIDHSIKLWNDHTDKDLRNEILTDQKKLGNRNRKRILKQLKESVSRNKSELMKQSNRRLKPMADEKKDNKEEENEIQINLNYGSKELINQEVSQQYTKILDTITGLEENIQKSLTKKDGTADKIDHASKNEIETKSKYSEVMLKDLKQIRDTLLEERKRIDKEKYETESCYDDYVEDRYNWPLIPDRSFCHIDYDAHQSSKPIKQLTLVPKNQNQTQKISSPIKKKSTTVAQRVHSIKYNTLHNRSLRLNRRKGTKGGKYSNAISQLSMHSNKMNTPYNRTQRRNSRIGRIMEKTDEIGQYFSDTYLEIINRHQNNRISVENEQMSEQEKKVYMNTCSVSTEPGTLETSPQKNPQDCNESDLELYNKTEEKKEVQEQSIKQRLLKMNLATLRRTLRLFQFLANWGFFFNITKENFSESFTTKIESNIPHSEATINLIRDILQDPSANPTDLDNLKYLDKDHLAEISNWNIDCQRLFLSKLIQWENYINIQKNNYKIKQLVIWAALFKFDPSHNNNSQSHLSNLNSLGTRKRSLTAYSHDLGQNNNANYDSHSKLRKVSKQSQVVEIEEFLKDNRAIPRMLSSNLSADVPRNKNDTNLNKGPLPVIKRQRAQMHIRKGRIVRNYYKCQNSVIQISKKTESECDDSNSKNSSKNISIAGKSSSGKISNEQSSGADRSLGTDSSTKDSEESIVSVILSILRESAAANEKKRRDIPIFREQLRNSRTPIADIRKIIFHSQQYSNTNYAAGQSGSGNISSISDQDDLMEDIINWIETNKLSDKSYIKLDSRQKKKLEEMLIKYCAAQARYRARVSMVKKANSLWLDKSFLGLVK